MPSAPAPSSAVRSHELLLELGGEEAARPGGGIAADHPNYSRLMSELERLNGRYDQCEAAYLAVSQPIENEHLSKVWDVVNG